MKSVAVELSEPPFDRNLPIRVPPEKPADDTQPDRLARIRRVWQIRRRVSRSHNFADKRTIQGLKFSIVKTLIREIERLMGADRIHQRRSRIGTFHIRGQLGQVACIGVASLSNL